MKMRLYKRLDDQMPFMRALAAVGQRLARFLADECGQSALICAQGAQRRAARRVDGSRVMRRRVDRQREREYTSLRPQCAQHARRRLYTAYDTSFFAIVDNKTRPSVCWPAGWLNKGATRIKSQHTTHLRFISRLILAARTKTQNIGRCYLRRSSSISTRIASSMASPNALDCYRIFASKRMRKLSAIFKCERPNLATTKKHCFSTPNLCRTDEQASGEL